MSKEKVQSKPINVVADAVVVILIEKLRMFGSLPEVCMALKNQANNLISKLQPVYQFLKDECLKESHPEWVGRLLKALYKAENKVDIFLYRSVERDQKTIRIVPDVLMTLTWKCSLHRQMNHFLNEVDGLLQDQHLDPRDTKSSPRPSEVPQYYERWQKVNAIREDPSYIGDYRVGTYEDVLHKLIRGDQNQLDEQYLSCVVIYGDEGTGKTYLAGRIFNSSKIKNHFEARAWVHVSSSLTLDDIRYAVLKQVKGSGTVLKNIEHMDPKEIRQDLMKELTNKRYLVVLDDFEDMNTWYEFVRYLPDWNNGSRVLITTRNSLMAHVADLRPIKLQNLEEQESSKLLQKKVNPVKAVSSNDEIQIFRVSSGCPLAIGLLGGLLVHMDPNDTKWPIMNEKVSLPEILTMSYNSLPQEEKPCFLYLTLFPKATPIPVRRILRLWHSEGLLTDPHMNPEDLGEKYLEDLILRSLVEVVIWNPDGTPRACQLVTSVYDMFRTQAVELDLLYIHDQKLSGPSQTEPVKFKGRQFNVRWLAEHSNIKNFCQENLNAILHIRSFISFYFRKGTLTKDLGTFLRIVTLHNSYRLLRVLDLEGVYKPYLLPSIGRLVLLKYLGLRSTVLDSLPSAVGDLPQLETLDIKNTNITVLPRSLWKSNYLRHLYLNGFHIDPSILRRHAGSRFLSNLRTLTGLYMGNMDEGLVNSLIQSVTKLTKLKINYRSSEKNENLGRWISKLTNLQSLKLGMTEKDGHLPKLTYLPQHHHLFNLYLLGKLYKMESDQLPSCLRVLTLSRSYLSGDPMHSLSQLQQLRSLSLLSDSYTGTEMSCLNGFPSLQVLKLWSLTKLQKLTLHKGCMSNLNELEIRDCAELQPGIGMMNLTSLKELTLSRMPKKFVQDMRSREFPESTECCLFVFDEYEVCKSNFYLMLFISFLL